MSNIFTSFLRVIPRPDRSIGRDEAEGIIDRMLNERGSYNVPVAVRRADDGSLLDIQAGCGKNPDFYGFWEDHRDQYACVWERFFDEGGFQDTITHFGQEGQTRHGAFWYGFDGVRVLGAADHLPDLGMPSVSWEPDGDGAWRAGVTGRYQTGNDRADIEKAGPCSTEVEWNPPVMDVAPGGLATTTTPSYWNAEIVRMEPDGLHGFVERGYHGTARESRVERVELLWRGRVVHRTQMEYDADFGEYEWEQRSADDWDNCLSPDYLASMRRVRRRR
ncbi:hypothetical protein A6A08_02740 [Nocardiopsis sp. TSRI0078]|uniref:hypothetical protein n=1 Tax=unclassified Nocardiopsis TaxID=2649073 RepID=UPI00093E07ED|nr:hypothetical protein [Nocardiopsis sp. TSRI0078]OKI23699.1 hypothetical protein A6A08_02740 [Nocardiopsis sp. TSRI0078]